MEIAYIVNMMVLSFAVSLGVGTSTVALTQMLVSLRAGLFGDENVRKLTGTVFIILRVAMVAILITLIGQLAIIYQFTGNFLFISPFFLSLYTVVGVLYLNAILMTFHVMPRSIGPAIQAGSWYALGALVAFIPLGLTAFAYLDFALFYAGWLFLAVAALNIAIKYLNPKT